MKQIPPPDSGFFYEIASAIWLDLSMINATVVISEAEKVEEAEGSV